MNDLDPYYRQILGEDDKPRPRRKYKGRTPNPAVVARNVEVVALRADGLKRREIAERLGITENYVGVILNHWKHGRKR